MSSPASHSGLQTLPVDERRVRRSLAAVVYRDGERTVSAGEVLDRLAAAGLGVYVCGGTPRDWLDGGSPRDFDVYVDCGLEVAHQVLLAAFPGIDPIRPLPLPHPYVFAWGGGGEASLDVGFLRSYRDLRGRDAFSTEFVPRSDLVEDALMRDFSINAFYYEVRERRLLDPLGCGLADLQQRQLRLISHPQMLESTFRVTLRIAQFLCRGYHLTESTRAHLARCADRDVLGMGRRLWKWVPNTLVRQGFDLGAFRRHLLPWLATEEARRLLDQVLADQDLGDCGGES